MKEKQMYQCRLQSGNAVQIVWLSDEKSFKVGDLVTLKDSDEPNRKWKITSKGEPHKFTDVKQTWKSQDLKRDSTRKKVI